MLNFIRLETMNEFTEQSEVVELIVQNDNIYSQRIKEKVSIIGTGDYGIALGKCLMNSGFEVIYGSRNANLDYLAKCFDEQKNENFKNYSVTTIGKALFDSDGIAFLTVSAKNSVCQNLAEEIKSQNIDCLPKTNPLVLVEISSNLDAENKSGVSDAEKLDSFLKCSLPDLRISVVKGFNIMSTYVVGMDRFESSLTKG